jgi:hypothetical protein
MAESPSLYASGTSGQTVGTEDILSAPDVAGVFTFHIDTTNLAAGDVLQVRVYQIVLHSGTSNVVYIANYQGAQPADDIIKVTPPIGNDLTDTDSLQFTINQTFGTTRAMPWKVLQY